MEGETRFKAQLTRCEQKEGTEGAGVSRGKAAGLCCAVQQTQVQTRAPH